MKYLGRSNSQSRCRTVLPFAIYESMCQFHSSHTTQCSGCVDYKRAHEWNRTKKTSVAWPTKARLIARVRSREIRATWTEQPVGWPDTLGDWQEGYNCTPSFISHVSILRWDSAISYFFYIFKEQAIRKPKKVFIFKKAQMILYSVHDNSLTNVKSNHHFRWLLRFQLRSSKSSRRESLQLLTFYLAQVSHE